MDYRYQAINQQGQPISGDISAGSEREVSRLLQQQDLTPIEIVLADPGVSPKNARLRSAGVQEKVLVIREIATLLEAGVPLSEAIASIAEAHGHSQVGRGFESVLKALRSGETLSRALRAADLKFPEYLMQLVAAGEITGKMAQAFDSTATQMEYEDRVRQEVRNALIYPLVLVVSGVTAVLLIFIVVVPKFASMIKTGKVAIPWISKWVITSGLFVQQQLLWLGLLAVFVILGAVVAFSNPRLRERGYDALTRLPMIGPWLRQTEVGRWAAMLSALLDNRVPIITAMELARNGVRLISLRSQLDLAIREVRGGKKLADALSTSHAVSPMGLNLIRVGERSGALDTMLAALAKLYENSSRDRMKRFLLLLEPLAILLIGGIIGTMMISIMLAITSLSNIPF